MEVKNIGIPSVTLIEHLKDLWEQSEIIILMVNMDEYAELDTGYLDIYERRQLEKLQTEYFKSRFIISRTVLKFVLSSILNMQSPLSVELHKDQNGKIHIAEHRELYPCISYTENMLAIAISKIEVGIDTEIRKKRRINNISKYISKSPKNLKNEKSGDMDSETDDESLIMWTIKEAYCKFSNTSACYYIKKDLDMESFCHTSCLINDRYLLSVVTESENYDMQIIQLEKIQMQS